MTWLTRVAVVAPALHISLCYYYLFVRSFGFGSNVSEFIAAGDVFTVGLSKLLSTYLLIAAGFIFAHLWMDSDPLKISGRTSFELHPSLERPTFAFLMGSIPYVTAVGI